MYKSVDVQTHPHARPLRSRRWIFASIAIAAIAVLGLLGTTIIRDRSSTRSEPPVASPAAAQTRDTTLAELNEMWAEADAGFAGLESPRTLVDEPAQAAVEPDPALWTIADHVTLTGDW
jgi:hypothetical protein